MIHLRDHLRNRIRYQRDRIRSGLRIRHERPWGEAPTDVVDDIFGGVTVHPDQRTRLHHGIRKGIRNLRKLRMMQRELLELVERARGAA